MNKLLTILIFLFSTIIVFSLGVIFVFYNPSILTRHITKQEGEIPQITDVKKSEETYENKQTNPPILSEENFLKLKSLLPRFFIYIKEGIVSHPALIFKNDSLPEKNEVHLITFSTMEWQFVKTKLGNSVLKSPDEVYICEDGIVALVYKVKNFWLPEIVRGKLFGEGILVIPKEKKNFKFRHFNGNCTDNGFVFTPGGELAGLCFGSKFIDAEELYRELPFACRLVYQKEERDGNLQSENGQLVR